MQVRPIGKRFTTFFACLPRRLPVSSGLASSCASWNSRPSTPSRGEHVLLERAFNILGDPALRACYDGLLRDAEAPALFPYGGFGSLLASGERSRDGKTFFARRIIAFLPVRRQRRFRA